MNPSSPDFGDVGPADEVPDGYVMPYYLQDRKLRVSMARIDDKLHAFDDLSTSDRSPLSSGLLSGTTIMSPCDGSRFDVSNGNVVNGPATQALATLKVCKMNGQIQLRV